MAVAASSDAGSERDEPREPVVPRLAATVALVRDAAGGPEVYLMRRPATMAFAPGVWVVAGGSVDAVDAETARVTSVSTVDHDRWTATGLSTVDAKRVLAAAVREVFEETAVLLAADRSGRVPALPAGRRVRRRTALRAGRVGLTDVLQREDLRLDERLLVPWSRWITPAWVPKRRFDTYFFVAALPAGQEPVRARTEASDARWLRPGEALDRHARGGLQLMIPTRALLGALAEVHSLATLRAELPWRVPDTGAMPAPQGGPAETERRMRGADRQIDPPHDNEGRRRR
jgi:8-oxo-dGTP pyrophosphatase MutT (NUDIX family)